MKRSITILVLTFVSAALFAMPGFAQQQGPPDAAPDSVRRAAAVQFQADHGSAWQIRWSEKTGTPATLMSGKARGYGGAPEQAGRAFLEDHARLFGIEDARANLRVARQNASQNGSARVLYQQIYQGVPVLASGYLVAVDEAGAVYYVSGDYYPDLELPSVTPSVGAQAVVRHMQDDLDAADPSSEFEVLERPELVVYVDKGDAGSGSSGADAGSAGEALSYHLAYVAEAQRRSPLAAFKYVIDAQSGAVLFKTSLVEDVGRHGFGGKTATTDTEDARAEPEATVASVGIVDGSGEVYLTNPLHGSPVTKTLHRLRDRSPRELYGYDVDINDRFGNDATSSSGAFDYSPSNFRFDQVMVYYHSDEFEAWLAGRLNWSDDTGEVDAETRSDACYACTVPSRENAFYSDGSNSSNRNPTREASVMAHEQMHIVSEKYDDLNHPGDGDALDEGYSDYFAVAYRHDWQSGQSTEVGEYALPGTDRELDNDFDDRDADNDDNDIDNFYDDSLVFSGALWDFTTGVATDVEEAATITLRSLGHLDADPSFLDARNALIAAAGDAGHSYTCGIKRAFADHGIGVPGYRVVVDGPGGVNPDWTVTWEADGYCGNPSYSYRWYKGSSPSSLSFTGVTSRTYTESGFYGEGTFYLKAEITDQDGRTTSDLHSVFVNEDGCGTEIICTNSAEAALADLLPKEFALEGSAPNPVRAGSQTQIRFALPEAAQVEIALYDMLGREVARLVDEQLAAGFHRAAVEATELSSGVYLYRMRASGASGSENFTDTGKLVVVK